MQNQVLYHINETAPSIRVSSVVKTLNGSDILEYVHNGTVHLVRVLTYVSGHQLKDMDHNELSILKLGNFLGNLDHALIGFIHPAATRKFPWDIRNIDFIDTHYSNLWDQRKCYLIDHFLHQYKQNVLNYEFRI